jgi:hypothetical protein
MVEAIGRVDRKEVRENADNIMADLLN